MSFNCCFQVCANILDLKPMVKQTTGLRVCRQDWSPSRPDRCVDVTESTGLCPENWSLFPVAVFVNSAVVFDVVWRLFVLDGATNLYNHACWAGLCSTYKA
jgi:hypothetical protein